MAVSRGLPVPPVRAEHREFHFSGDNLVIYVADENRVLFVRLGTHAELFE